ncbi:acetyl-coenzyme A transporter 1-like isoform X7 [Daktulosphaira vitifoliae]|uniref:acetyl-coenzyme A transporter 1-like isoform X6 n=1 Tax=Daktulosphaira vitifoliae TaxID=58002 RepID=UPI0021AA5200|nr:acetyl-coenzyme A transporter 1-like isoform X6 [Daktulosphaira vitifoliae]XP_050523110.1 acetyl-coenzyme A transporter 1-like isoform X7 [Daktulosphaira vitifoliae]
MEDSDKPKLVKPNLKGEWKNIFLLLLLYMLQGIPMGLSFAIPLILQNQKVSYTDQALFSTSAWPFSLKLLWAPIVDTWFIKKIGRRKSWLLPVQFLLGVILIYTAANFNDWMYKEKPNIQLIVIVFFFANFLAATQDIAVDGWALTMLKKENVGYASTCNSSGQAVGILLGYVLPILLDSESFGNNYLRSTPAKGSIYFWGIAFMIITSLVGLFEKENQNSSKIGENEPEHSIIQTYSLLWRIIKLPNIRILIFALLTYRIAFAATDYVTSLKLLEAGLPKDNFLIVSIALYPFKIILPLVVTKYTSGPKPMSALLNAFPFRLFSGLFTVLLVYYTPKFITQGNYGGSFIYYILFGLIMLYQELLMYYMFVAIMGFFSRISDPQFGGTYMTLLNTISNLGLTWTATASLGMIDWLTINTCTCRSSLKDCDSSDKTCAVSVDGYYLETVICTIIGMIWYIIYNNKLRKMQVVSKENWSVKMKKSSPENVDKIFTINLE